MVTPPVGVVQYLIVALIYFSLRAKMGVVPCAYWSSIYVSSLVNGPLFAIFFKLEGTDFWIKWKCRMRENENILHLEQV